MDVRFYEFGDGLELKFVEGMEIFCLSGNLTEQSLVQDAGKLYNCTAEFREISLQPGVVNGKARYTIYAGDVYLFAVENSEHLPLLIHGELNWQKHLREIYRQNTFIEDLKRKLDSSKYSGARGGMVPAFKKLAKRAEDMLVGFTYASMQPIDL